MEHGDEAPSGMLWSQMHGALIERIGRLSTDDVLGLLESGSATEKRQAALELGKRREMRAFEALLSLLRDPDHGVKTGAALALEHLGDPAAVPPFSPRFGSCTEMGRERVLLPSPSPSSTLSPQHTIWPSSCRTATL